MFSFWNIKRKQQGFGTEVLSFFYFLTYQNWMLTICIPCDWFPISMVNDFPDSIQCWFFLKTFGMDLNQTSCSIRMLCPSIKGTHKQHIVPINFVANSMFFRWFFHLSFHMAFWLLPDRIAGLPPIFVPFPIRIWIPLKFSVSHSFLAPLPSCLRFFVPWTSLTFTIPFRFGP